MKAAARGNAEMVADLLIYGALKEPQYPTGDVPRYPPKTAIELAQARGAKSNLHATCSKLLGSKVTIGLIKAFQAAGYAFGAGTEALWLAAGTWT